MSSSRGSRFRSTETFKKRLCLEDGHSAMRWRHTRALRMAACLVALGIFALAAWPSEMNSNPHARALSQFNDVGSFGVGGFPSFHRNWWLPLFPTSCFTIGTSNPLYLTQCFAFTTSF